MKRTPFVVIGTAVGLAAVLGFRSTPVSVHLNLPTASVGTSGATGSTGSTSTSSTGSSSTGVSVGVGSSTTTSPSSVSGSTKASLGSSTPATLTAFRSATTSTASVGGHESAAATTTTVKKTAAKKPTTTKKKPTTTTTVKKKPTTTTTVKKSSAKKVLTGPLVNYYYGVLSVKVTVANKKITSLAIGQLTDGGNPRSAVIDNAAIPILEKAVLGLPSSQQHSLAVSGNNPQLNVVAVSGATYTSAGFDVSLQNALYTLKKQGLI